MKNYFYLCTIKINNKRKDYIMNGKSHVIKNIYHHLNTYGEFLLWEVNVHDEVNDIYIKASKIYINNENIAMVELENGNEVDIEELSYDELLEIYEEIV